MSEFNIKILLQNQLISTESPQLANLSQDKEIIPISFNFAEL